MTIQQWGQILQILVLVMTTVVIPIVGFYVSQFLKHHAALLRNDRTSRAARMLVQAAEEIFPDSKNGPEKENYASLLLKQWFPFLTDDETMALIHSSVLALKGDLNVLYSISSSPAEKTDNPPNGPSPSDKLL